MKREMIFETVDGSGTPIGGEIVVRYVDDNCNTDRPMYEIDGPVTSANLHSLAAKLYEMECEEREEPDTAIGFAEEWRDDGVRLVEDEGGEG